MSAPMLSQLAFAAGAVTAVAINALWEDALLVVCVWLLLRAWPGLNAATRYMVWSATLVATVVVPVATTLPFIVPSSPPTAMRDTAVRAPMPMVTHALTAAPAAAAKAAAHSSLAARSPVKATPERSEPAPLRLPERFRMTLPLPLAAGVLAAWILLALVSLVRLGIGLARLEGLKRDALPLPVEYREAMARWTSANKGSREVRLCVSDEIDVPVAVGLFDSMILIPRALLERLSQAEVDQISLHELAHLRRADDWSNGLQRLVLALFAWNPGVLFVGRQLDLEREVACDDWVLALTGLVRPYALCLTKMAETSSWPYRPMPAPGVFATRRHISLRIERLLGAGRNAATNLSLGPAAAAIAIVAALAFAMQLVAPSVAASVETPATLAATRPPHAAQRQVSQTVERKRTVVALEQKTVAATSPAAASPAAASKASASPSASPQTLPSVVHVPATHVHVPARQISVPAIDVDVPAMTIPIPQLAQLQSAKMKLRMAQSMHVGAAVAAAGAASRAAASLAPFHVIAQSSSAKTCTGCDMSGVDWSGRDMRNVSYTGVDLSKAKLQGTNFGGGTFSGVDFSGASLRNASFRGAHLVGCDFSRADLSGVDFTGATISGCQFTGAQLPSAQLRAVLDTCSGCDFSHANLSGLDLSNVRANGIDFTHANLSNVNFSGARFTGTDFTASDLRGANFTGAELNGCDLSGVDLSHVDLSRAKLIGTDLSQGRPHP